jgi:MerR family transcriptional regulator, light-induced transcriptional regulator
VTTSENAIGHFEPAYRSGAAARLAGIPVETLRVWERRYQIVGPRLSPRGHRLYSAEDVSRLALIKQLVDLGSPVGSVAGLPLAALREMKSAATAASQGSSGAPSALRRPFRVALVGEGLVEQVAHDGALNPALEIVATCAGQAGAAEALRGISADVLAIEMPTLQTEAIATVDALVHAVGARHAVVEYRFAPAAVIGALRGRGHTVVRAPLDADDLERLCRDAIAPDAIRGPVGSSPLPLDVVPGPRFDDQSLTRLARGLTTLYCECPRHLVDLLLSLGSFERYSTECANRSPSDAVLHRHLQRVAGSARVLFEDALERVARAEGLALPADVGKASLEA